MNSIVNGREEGRKVGKVWMIHFLMAKKQTSSTKQDHLKIKGVNHERPKIFRLQQVPMGCSSILGGKKTLNNVTLTIGPIQITS